MAPYKWILMHFASYEKIMTDVWMSAMLFDSLGFHKDFTLHPSRGSNAIDLVCPLSFPLKDMLPRRHRPPFAVTFIILAWQREHERSVPLKNKINAKTVAVMREALQFTTVIFLLFVTYQPLGAVVGRLGFCFALKQWSVAFPADFSGVGAAGQVLDEQKLICTFNF